MGRKVFGFLTLLLCLTAGTAFGHYAKDQHDWNDTAGPLDMTWVAFADTKGTNHCQRRKCIFLQARMQRWWANRALKRGYVAFYLDVRGNTKPDYQVVVRHEKGTLKALIYNYKSLKVVGWAHAYRYHKWVVAFFLPRKVRPIQQVVRWRVETYFWDRRICPRTCYDTTGRYSHRWGVAEG
jgi:hypothetical protein